MPPRRGKRRTQRFTLKKQARRRAEIGFTVGALRKSGAARRLTRFREYGYCAPLAPAWRLARLFRPGFVYDFS
jgi:hypothetical protein